MASAIIDGEVVAPADDGATDFSVLQNELKGKSTRIVLVAFDLLYLNGYDLRKLPLVERKAQLKKIIDGTDLQFSETFEIDGREMFAHTCKLGLEGIVSKHRDRAYQAGRSTNWIKVKNPASPAMQRAEDRRWPPPDHAQGAPLLLISN
jgi:bifunctional non-homologous end joining protein LigD